MRARNGACFPASFRDGSSCPVYHLLPTGTALSTPKGDGRSVSLAGSQRLLTEHPEPGHVGNRRALTGKMAEKWKSW